jgi:hypothetical protein
MKTIRVGSGAGFSDDRIEPAVELAQHGRLDYLVFECLAERTIALAQQARLTDPGRGYDPYLRARMEAVLELCLRERRIRIITNMGAANPLAAAEVIAEVARERGLSVRIATVTGDDVLEQVRERDLPLRELGQTVSSLGDRVVSANAYLGCEPVVEALDAGADVVVTGRIADPSLYVAPLVHEFGWSVHDPDLIGTGIAVGHLLECSGQVTGGYFADPGVKDVPDLARLGFPLAEVAQDGSFQITKVPGSGGRVTVATCTEQILYEVHDPARYLSADAVANFSQVRLEQVSDDAVAVTGAGGSERPPTLKVSVGYLDGAIGGGEVSYAGPNAVARARLAADVVAERLQLTGVQTSELRFDLVGVDAVHRGAGPTAAGEPAEVRLRVAGRADSEAEAARVAHEVFTLGVSGPAAGGGLTRFTRSVVAVASTLLPRDAISPRVTLVQS